MEDNTNTTTVNGDVSCEDCAKCALMDYGYSNYTVEGTEFSCMVGAHPDGDFDRFYGEEKRLQWARECPEFELGEPIFMDVDMEELPHLTDAQKFWWDRYQAKS